MMTLSRKTFRFLLLLNWVLCIACMVLWFVEKRAVPPELRSYIDRNIDKALTTGESVTVGLGLVILALTVAAYVGLYRFRTWGRSLFVFSLAVAFVPLPPYEPYVGMIFSSYVGYLSCVLTGFILALLYFSPLSQYFEPRGDGRQTFKGSDTPWQT